MARTKKVGTPPEARQSRKKAQPEVEDIDLPGVDDQDEDETPDRVEEREDGDARLRRAADGQRRSRAADDSLRADDDGLTTSVKRRQSWRDEWTQEALPRLPELPGFHLCWLSSTNQYDSIPKRIRMGYAAVKPEEMPGFDHLTLKSGEWSGFIGINEMLLFKIPTSVYQDIMREWHHKSPLEEEASIKNDARAAAEELTDSKGQPMRVEFEGGMEDLGVAPRTRPNFTN